MLMKDYLYYKDLYFSLKVKSEWINENEWNLLAHKALGVIGLTLLKLVAST